MMRNRSFTAGAKVALAVLVVLLIAAVLVGALLGFSRSKETSGFTTYTAALDVEYESDTFDFDALKEDAASILGNQPEITFNASTTTGNAIMTITYIPAPEDAVKLSTLSSKIAADYFSNEDSEEVEDEEPTEITFTEAVYQPSITAVDYGIYAVCLGFVLIIAFLLLCIFFSYRNPFSAAFTVLAALCDVLAVIGLHAICRLPAGRPMLTSAAIALVVGLFVNFFLMAELGNTRMSKKKFTTDEADEILYAGYQKNLRAAIIIVILLGGIVATALIMGATGLAMYFISCLIGLLVPLFSSVFLFSAAFGTKISVAQSKKR